MGAQLIGGLDPNATVNAWGGPTYAGALLAHWLDAIVGCYAAAFLLGRVLLPFGEEEKSKSAGVTDRCFAWPAPGSRSAV
jgi:hypothetical protein